MGAAHMLAVHFPPAQSVGFKHVLPSAHFPHVPPPQSTSVSAPFFILSLQVAAAVQTLPAHVALEQSAATRHALPSWHGGHIPPPQSTSVSAPSFIMFPQPAAA